MASATPQVIDLLDDEDELQEVAQHGELVTPVRKRHPSPPPRSVDSQQSAGSRPTSRGLPSTLQTTNEFMGMESVLGANRKSAKSRKLHLPAGNNPSKRSISGSVTPRIHAPTELSEEDEDVAAARASRRSILKSFKQGVKDGTNDSGKAKETTSPYFANARINESISDKTRPTAAATDANEKVENLRSFKRATATGNDDTVSDDELGLDFPPSTRVAPLRTGTPSKSARPGNSGVRRMSKAQEAAQGWPLIWARTHDFDSYQTSMSNTHEHPLILRHGRDLDTLEIVVWRDEYHDQIVSATITPKKVIKVQADDVGRIRLEGPRGTEGNQPIFDLEFKSTEHFDEFCRSHVPNYCPSHKVFTKSEDIMKLMFKRPLNKNGKVGTSPLVPEVFSAEGSTRSTRAQADEASLRGKSKGGTQRTSPPAAGRGHIESLDATVHTRTSTRPTRATRATAPTYDSYDTNQGNEVEKYSEVQGLGTPWVKVLEYHEGRHRSTVSFNDLPRLDEEEFLNDSLIDFYMIYLFKQSKLPVGKVHFFNTFFYTSLTQNTGRESINYDAVKRWTSRVDVFDFDYIVVPINQDAHWYLAIICNVKNIARKAIEEDFDGGAPEKGAGEESAPVTDGDAPATREKPAPVCADDDANLFDEESELNLINPEAIRMVEDQPEENNAVSPRLSPSRLSATRATPPIFDSAAPFKSVLSNLHASPEKKKKKKSKRRSTVPRKDPMQPVIIILDSLGQTRSPTVRALKDWIAAEGEAKRGMEAIIKENGFYAKADQIPTQNNFSDCGVYLLGYAEKFFQNPDEFKRQLLTGEMTPAEDWPQLKPKEMRNNLREIIVEMAKEQQLTVPTKKKKGRKGEVADKSSTLKADTDALEARPASPRLKQPPAKAEKPGAGPLHTTPAATDAQPPNAQSGSPAAVHRLGSPFSFVKADDSAFPGKVPARTMRSVSPGKTGSTTPHHDYIHGRRTHPEVRVSKRVSPMEATPEKLSKVQAKTETLRERLPQAGRSFSPLKSTKHSTDGVKRVASSTKSTPGLQSIEREDNAGFASTKKHNENGHSDFPIEISDSQEPSVTVLPSPPRASRPPPIPRDQPSKLSHQTHTLTHEPSFEEIPGFPPRVRQSKGNEAKGEFIGRQLYAQLDADDVQRLAWEEANRQGRAVPSLQRSQSDSDILEMEVDSRGNDPMDTADDVISETPEAARRSPSNLPL